MTGKRTASVKYDCVDTFISKWIKVAHWFSRLKFIFFIFREPKFRIESHDTNGWTKGKWRKSASFRHVFDRNFSDI